MSDHEAGRELDALVAERVMGVDPATFRYHAADRHDDSPFYATFGIGDWPLAVAQSKCAEANERGRAYRPEVHNVPFYSTDIAAAVTVFDVLGGFVRILRGVTEWQCSLGEQNRWAETLPLAICRAALAAVEVPA